MRRLTRRRSPGNRRRSAAPTAAATARGTLLMVLVIALTVEANTPAVAAGSDVETWVDLTTIYNISRRWQYTGDQGIRRENAGTGFTTFYFRPSVSYRINGDISVMGGVRLFHTDLEAADDPSEAGPWQGLKVVWPRIGGYAVSHLLRLEERTIFTAGISDFYVRGRYRLEIRSPAFDVLFKNGMYLLGSVEVFSDLETPLSDSFVNRIRYDFGVGTAISDTWRVALHYLRHQHRRDAGGPFTTGAHIVRLRLYYTFN